MFVSKFTRMFSKSCEYGIKATLYVMQKSLLGQRVSLNDIAEAIDSPTAFTAKVLQSLSKNKIIQSIKGYYGGYEVTREKIDKLTLFDIVHAIDGDPIYNGCGLGMKECNASMPCPIHNEFAEVRDSLKKMLRSTYVKDLASELEQGRVYLKRHIN